MLSSFSQVPTIVRFTGFCTKFLFQKRFINETFWPLHNTTNMDCTLGPIVYYCLKQNILDQKVSWINRFCNKIFVQNPVNAQQIMCWWKSPLLFLWYWDMEVAFPKVCYVHFRKEWKYRKFGQILHTMYTDFYYIK